MNSSRIRNGLTIGGAPHISDVLRLHLGENSSGGYPVQTCHK